jgi:DNA repair exonuclease SbcCD ATPase subunit
VAQKVLIAAAQKKVLDSLVVVLNSDIRSYEIAVKELSIKDSTNKEIIATYENIIKAKDEQRKVLEDQIVVLNKEVKKWKRKQKWTALAGIVGTVGGIVATVFAMK